MSVVLVLALVLGAPVGAGEPGAALLASDRGEAAIHRLYVDVAWEGRIAVARCYYEGGSPAVGADVRVISPGGAEPYQSGRTDAGGLFAFLPQEPGRWRVVVDDGMGHRGEARLEVEAEPVGGEDAGAVAPGPVVTAGSASRAWPLVTGLSLIFGLSGFAFGISGRGRARSGTA